MHKLSIAAALAAVAGAAHAAPPIDFSSIPPGTNNTALNATETLGGVTADGLIYGGGTAFKSVILWLRDQKNDHGLGVCSEGADACKTGGGDVNELSNQKNDEVIRLTAGPLSIWTDVWVSSLDAGGSNDLEQGLVYWSNSATPDLSVLKPIEIDMGDITGGGVEGSIWKHLIANGFDATADYIFFRADPTNLEGGKANNDYLVWGVGTKPIPEPGTYALMGVGLALTAFAFRRTAHQG
ncbi:MAG: PEP-CTERM sorting domain-containing protein [Burkholderiales bacterium]|nr:PEP-CTERM sorting domain-containing protein [Burkholderiales bacterium]